MVPIFSGPEVIKREYSLKLNIKCIDCLLADKQPIIPLKYVFETELKFYIRGGAWSLL